MILLRRGVRAFRDFWARVRQGFTILRRRGAPGRWSCRRRVGWGCRVGPPCYFLARLRIHATCSNALAGAGRVAARTLMPFTPGGAAPSRRYRGRARRRWRRGRRCSRSWSACRSRRWCSNVTVGLLCLALMVRTLSLRQAIAHARDQQASHEAGGARGAYAQGRRSQYEGRARRDGSNRAYACSGSDVSSLRARAVARRELRHRVAHLPASAAHRPSGSRTARRRRPRRCARSRRGSGRSPTAGAAAPHPRRAACTRRTARGTPPAATRRGRGRSARPAPGRGA